MALCYNLAQGQNLEHIANMENQSNAKRIILYFILYRLMDVEEIMWNVAEFAIKPVALLRRKVAYWITLTK